MRAAKTSDHPSFTLMKQNDVQNLYYMQMPLWLFSDPRYSELSLDAKVTYTFLLNRFQLSRRNGWTNEAGEVFVIFPRKMLAKELRICEQRVTAAFRALAGVKLIWEKRCGRGDANQIYLAAVEPVADPAYECTPFLDGQPNTSDSKTADSDVFEFPVQPPPSQDPQDLRAQNSEICTSRTADSAIPDLQIPQSRKNDSKNPEQSHFHVSQSVNFSGADEMGQTEEHELADILDACELYSFTPETAAVFEAAIERLYYTDRFRIGNASLPQMRVRARLRQLDGLILRSAEQKLTANQNTVIRSSIAYIMTVIFNCISESEGDLLIDPYLNSLRVSAGGG